MATRALLFSTILFACVAVSAPAAAQRTSGYECYEVPEWEEEPDCWVCSGFWLPSSDVVCMWEDVTCDDGQTSYWEGCARDDEPLE